MPDQENLIETLPGCEKGKWAHNMVEGWAKG